MSHSVSRDGGTAGVRRVEFARWRSDFASGGNRYDDELTAALRALGVDVSERDVPGQWPCPEPSDREQFSGMLGAGDHWLIDNIVGSASPHEIRAAVTAGRRVTLLMHYFPSDDLLLSTETRTHLATSECAAVWAASTVVVTSAWAAHEVASRYGRRDAVVARPGVRLSDVAPGFVHLGGSPTFLWLARITAQKDPLTFLDALFLLQDLHWNANLVGPDDVDPALSTEIHRRLAAQGLGERARVLGPRTGADLEALWAGTDLLVHTSGSETYGMVVTEALARGIPSVVATGTGAVEAQKVGGTFPRRDAAALAQELRRWLTKPQLRQRWRDDASERRNTLPSWEETARIVASVLV